MQRKEREEYERTEAGRKKLEKSRLWSKVEDSKRKCGGKKERVSKNPVRRSVALTAENSS